MRFDIELSDRAVDLVDEGFDLGVRIGEIGSQNLIGRKIGITHLTCCAAPSYVERMGEPRKPQDLNRHACLTYEYASQRNVWPFRDRHGNDHSVRIDGPFHANSGRFLVALAVEGVGICCEPDFTVGPDVRAGRLVQLLRDYPSPPTTIYVVYPSRRHLSAKVRVFTEFLTQRFAAPDWLLTATGSSRPRRRSGSASRPAE
jgi:DNA-binding transcriptional LysR family regulator